MTLLHLARRSAAYYWRTNLAVVAGVATASAVLGGALLVGDSVRGSLREMALARLGKTDVAVSSAEFFPVAAADRFRAALQTPVVPLIVASGFVTHEASGRRAGRVAVYGVDERFWSFHGVAAPSGPAASAALASELGAAAGDTLLVRLQRPSEIPLESLYGHKDDIGRTVRLALEDILPRERLGEFSIRQHQAELRAVFAPIERIQRDLSLAGRANTLLIAGADERRVAAASRSELTLPDIGVNVRAAADDRTVIVDTASGILSEPLEAAVRAAGQKLGYAGIPVFTYLANSIRVGDRTIPYSLITATDLQHVTPGRPERSMLLNSWAARELGAAIGQQVEIEYYLWDANAGLTTERRSFTLDGVVAIEGMAADRQLAPEYPGITEAQSLADWDPPFPIDLSKVRPADEQYWEDYRATPKAFIGYEHGRELWRTRYGAATSVRFALPPRVAANEAAGRLSAELRASLPPGSLGVTTVPVRQQALAASAGATDFGEYFTYFSFFLVVSALLLSVLFFRLGVEQRLRQLGVLRASGFSNAVLRRVLLVEALALAIVGALLGAVGAIGYAHLIVFGLRTWWVGAVGTSELSVHMSLPSIAAGVLGGIVAAVLCVVLSLRSVAKVAPRALLSAQSIGEEAAADERIGRRNRRLSVLFAVVTVAAITAGSIASGAEAAAFFSAGAAALIAAMFFLSFWLRTRPSAIISGRGIGPVLRLGFRSTSFRPARSVLSAALIASAAFIIVSVDAFRKGPGEVGGDRASGTGGYALVATSELSLVHNPNDAAGREALAVSAPEFASAKFTRFRIRPGDDASCLNLYRPSSPTIIAPEPAFLHENRFTFAASLASSDTDRRNPWLLLTRPMDDGTIPVVADATSLRYVLHAAVGDTFSMDIGAERPLQLRFVGSLSDSVLQGELIMSEENFVRLFPSQQGYRFFLIDAEGIRTKEAAGTLAGVLERELRTVGFDAVTAAERLEAFHRVENTYLSTFQSLGGLGLVLGTIGLAAVMFRNVLERRRELGLLRAVGYDRRRIVQMILAEALFLLAAGLAAGAISAALAVAPAWLGRGGTRPGGTLLALLLGVAVAGVFSSALAARAALRGDVLTALRAE